MYSMYSMYSLEKATRWRPTILRRKIRRSWNLVKRNPREHFGLYIYTHHTFPLNLNQIKSNSNSNQIRFKSNQNQFQIKSNSNQIKFKFKSNSNQIKFKFRSNQFEFKSRSLSYRIGGGRCQSLEVGPALPCKCAGRMPVVEQMTGVSQKPCGGWFVQFENPTSHIDSDIISNWPNQVNVRWYQIGLIRSMWDDINKNRYHLTNGESGHYEMILTI